MYSKKDLMACLEQMGIEKEGTLLVHSSCKSIGEVEERADTVLDALSDYMADGLLVLPTHTWKYISKDNPVFDVNKSPSNVGVLTELFRNRKNTIRSEHPTHSVAALGKEADTFTAGEYKHETPCARESVWGKVVDRKAQILLIGVDLTRNTFIHGIEEWLDIPNRMTDHHEDLFSVLNSGEKVRVPSRRHCGLSWSEHFWKVNDLLIEEGAMKTGRFGDAETRVVDAQMTSALLTELLEKNPELFTENKPLEPKWRCNFRNKRMN